jgi:hypothetical protein
MRVIDCVQGTYEWFAARLGIPTASRIGTLVTAGGKVSTGAGRRTYALELVAERITGQVAIPFQTDAMERGHLMEQAAREWYKKNVGDVQEVGFVMHDVLNAGCSPDGVVMVAGGIEVKCPLIKHYIDILETGEIPKDWLWQIHDCMYITGANWWDFVLYTDVEPFGGWVKRVERDERAINVIDEALHDFCAEVDAMETKIRERIAEHRFTRVPGYEWADTWEVQ